MFKLLKKEKFRIRVEEHEFPLWLTLFIPGVGPLLWLMFLILSPGNFESVTYYIERKDGILGKWRKIRNTTDKEEATRWLNLYNNASKK